MSDQLRDAAQEAVRILVARGGHGYADAEQLLRAALAATPAPALDVVALLTEWVDQWDAFGDSPMSSTRPGLAEDSRAAIARAYGEAGE